MPYTDLVLSAILIIAFISGFIKGFIHSFFGFVGFIVGLYLGVVLSTPIAARIEQSPDPSLSLVVVSFLVIWIFISIASHVTGLMLRKVINMTFFGILDKITGGFFGVLKWIMILSLFVWVFNYMEIGEHVNFSRNSIIWSMMEGISNHVILWVTEVFPSVDAFFERLNVRNEKLVLR
jgi:membrane protein required for colicin V production